MMDDMITMDDMQQVFQVTDALGIDREHVSVPLGKEDPGEVRPQAGGRVEVVLPLTTPLQEWLPTLRAELERLGFEPAEEEEDEDL